MGKPRKTNASGHREAWANGHVAPESFLRALWRAALAAVQPACCMPPFIPTPAPGRNLVVGMGKAAGHMALALERDFSGSLEGLVAVPEGYTPATSPGRIQLQVTAHPLPDGRSLAAGEALLAAVSGLTERDQVIAVISGGGSAAAEALIGDMEIEHYLARTRALLDSGAEISELNAFRRGHSRLKAGGLARAAAPARVVTLAISDVPGDDPAIIASGPTWLDAGSGEYRCIASGATALGAAANLAEGHGLKVVNLGDRLQGEVRDLGREHARMARRRALAGTPALILSGGEARAPVTHRDGRGGRNQAYLLALALALDGQPRVWALAADTDGQDGTDPVAGALIGPDTLAGARALGVDPVRALAEDRSYDVFDALGVHLRTGPTGTNVNDFRAILVLPN